MSNTEASHAQVTTTAIINQLRAVEADSIQEKYDSTYAIRVEMLAILLKNPEQLIADPKLTMGVRGILDSMDKQTATQQKLAIEKEANNNANDNVMALYALLQKQHGRGFRITCDDADNDPKLIPKPQAACDVVLPTDEFTIAPHELIMGIDTEDSILS